MSTRHELCTRKDTPLSRSRKASAFPLLGAWLILLCLAQGIRAASLVWDSGGASATSPADGGGSWNTASAWWSNGSANLTWTNTALDVAVFGSGNGAAGTVVLGEAITCGGLTFNAAGSGSYTLGGGALTLGGATPTIQANVNATLLTALNGANGFVKTGSGVLTLGGQNNVGLSGVLTISEGVVACASLTNLPGMSASTGKIALNGGTLRFEGFTGYTALQRGLILTPAGGALEDSPILGGAKDYVSVAPGTVVLSGSGPRTLILTGAGNEGSSFSGILTDGEGGATTLIKNGTGNWYLSAVNTYTGDTIINAGTLQLYTTLVNPLPTNNTLRIAAGSTLQIGTHQTIHNLQDGTGGGGTISQLFSTGTFMLTVEQGAFSGLIKNANASRLVGLTKNTEGTLTLSGACTYTGPTMISGGKLMVNGSLAAGSAVSLGAATLGGSGTVAGPVTTSGTSSRIAPGGSVGTLTLGALDASNGARFDLELGSSSDRVAVTGAFTGSSTTGGLVFDFAATAGLQTKTPYTILTFASATGLDAADLVAGTLPDDRVLDPGFGDGNGFQINAGSLQVQFSTIPLTVIVVR